MSPITLRHPRVHHHSPSRSLFLLSSICYRTAYRFNGSTVSKQSTSLQPTSLSIILNDLEIIARRLPLIIETLASAQDVNDSIRETPMDVESEIPVPKVSDSDDRSGLECASRFQKPAMTASRSHFIRAVAYASRHREIIAINVTDGEDVPVFVRSDYMSLSNRQAA